ncbi:MAG: cell division protein FtsA [Bacteroidales bacterium]|nr:cell division protein FtsA [Bacteroidales bacterium]
MRQIVTAIDIGTTKTVAIAGERNEQGKIEILGIGEAESKGVIRGSVQNIGEVCASVKEAVEKCQNATKVTFKNVFVGIAGRNIRGVTNRHSKAITNNIITDEDINQLTRELYNMSTNQGEEVIHVIPQGYKVDNVNVKLNPEGCNGKKLEGTFYVIIGKENSVKNIKQAINMAGLNINKLILEPLATAEAVLTQDEKEAGVLVADIGGGTTDIAVFQDNVTITTAVVPIGGNVITSDLKKGCSVLERQAEQLKIQFGAALSQKDFDKKVASIKSFNGRDSKEIPFTNIANIINARVDEILGGIAYELDSPDFPKDNLSAGIVVTGGSASLKNIAQLIKFRLGLDVRIGFPNNSNNIINSPKYSTAYGLIIKGFEYVDNYIKIRKKEEESKKTLDNQHNNNNKNKDKKEETTNKSSSISTFFKKIANNFFKEPDDVK